MDTVATGFAAFALDGNCIPCLSKTNTELIWVWFLDVRYCLVGNGGMTNNDNHPIHLRPISLGPSHTRLHVIQQRVLQTSRQASFQEVHATDMLAKTYKNLALVSEFDQPCMKIGPTNIPIPPSITIPINS